jgi:Flp pilus assembly protein TadD
MALVESDLENAEMHFANAIENDPTIPIVRNNMGFSLIARGEFGAASTRSSRRWWMTVAQARKALVTYG